MVKKRKAKPPAKAPLRLPRYWSSGLLLGVILFFGLIRIRLLTLPLERDEGEYAYAGQLILHGIAPYRFCYTMKLPGTAAAYALIEAIFGQTPTGIHLGLLLVASATTILVYFLATRLFGTWAGVVAGASFAFLSVSPSVLGFAGHATQFVVLPAVGGILILLRAIAAQRLRLFLWSGILLGLAGLMKQPGVFFVVFGIFWLVQSQWRRPLEWRKLSLQSATLLCGAAIPLGLTCLLLFRTGVFQKFWFWTFSYASEYGTAVPLSTGVQLLWEACLSVIGPAWPLWLLAAAGIALMIWEPKTRTHVSFAAGFLIFSFAATSSGLYFRNHYFVLMLPAVALLCAGGVQAGTGLLLGSDSTRKWAALPALVFLFALVFSVLLQREVFFVMDPLAACRKFYPTNPFAEAVQISDFLKNHSTPADRIAVIGSEPEIYFYSDRLSATGYVYMYPLMEPQPFASTMQKEMIAEIELAHPRFIVFVDATLSWLRRSDSDLTILQWAESYTSNGYRVVGVADMLQEGTEYHWADAATYRPRSFFRLFVFERVS